MDGEDAFPKAAEAEAEAEAEAAAAEAPRVGDFFVSLNVTFSAPMS